MRVEGCAFSYAPTCSVAHFTNEPDWYCWPLSSNEKALPLEPTTKAKTLGWSLLLPSAIVHLMMLPPRPS